MSRRYVPWGKRLFDITVSLLLLLLLGPVLLVISFLVFLNLGRPIFFRQTRIGAQQKEFIILKFRTMKEPHSRNERSMSEEYRLTTFGEFLRNYGLDEMPQLVNILKGEMSFVGPRPLLPSYLPYFTDRERVRFKMKPGITGLAQISGRNSLSWSKRFVLDTEYVRTTTLKLDWMILIKTFFLIVKRDALVASHLCSSPMALDVERANLEADTSNQTNCNIDVIDEVIPRNDA